MLGRERQERLKARHDHGGIILPIHLDHVTVGLMMEVGAVDEAGSRSRKRLGAAALRILNNALITAVSAGRKLSQEQEEHHARENTEGDRTGLRQHFEDPAEADNDRGGRKQMARGSGRALRQQGPSTASCTACISTRCRASRRRSGP
ncbi:hypothetical protein RFM98_14920 [Mesorhizobium sp. VK9D]|uniref:hypothetical protein n=1 Tax=Mesorhizobium australafricanum TaxID=3072311 RepID=UPI002A246455|nr:hypothetical protein [Mesorhizobium sp. VK9D]MDX8454052.1 hypothetical protein [Mesorhizobium sp. VK9D]